MIFLTLSLRSIAICYIKLILKESRMPKYAVAVGRKVGIFDTYDECKLQVVNYPKAKFKKFATFEDAEAFIKEHSKFGHYSSNVDPMLQVSKENVNKPELIKLEKISPKDDVFTLMTRIRNIEERLNKFITETNTKLEKLIARMNPSEINVDTINEPPSKKIKVNHGPKDLVTNDDGFVVVYTDGACSQNGKTGAKAGIGVWFNDDHPLNVSAPVQGPATNNNAEIQAARVAITQAGLAGVRKLSIKTDSKFVINCITQWIHKWKKNDWKLATGGPVKNKDELIKLDNAIQDIEVVEWIYVKGHRGIRGNEMADKLARAGADRYKTNLTFSNNAHTYNVKYVNYVE
ncbi:ribonuclease H1 [Halyomorpha halys]|uniref:ribonuclease H1 n=1 Tax=Halyomorpha halys TaxID=286706 RepID=UPI0006D4FD73|nr:ribonuclease H1 [Halyomorpha halys]